MADIKKVQSSNSPMGIMLSLSLRSFEKNKGINLQLPAASKCMQWQSDANTVPEIIFRIEWINY